MGDSITSKSTAVLYLELMVFERTMKYENLVHVDTQFPGNSWQIYHTYLLSKNTILSNIMKNASGQNFIASLHNVWYTISGSTRYPICKNTAIVEE